MTLSTLYDVPALAPIARAAEHAGVAVELFGSVATRAFLHDQAELKPDTLFDLVEHVADIDLAHNGPPEASAMLRQAIAAHVPMAQWFRWSIVDRTSATELEALRRFNIHVPLRELRIGMREMDGLSKSKDLVARALEGEVDLLANDDFGASPRARHDTEASAALLYLDTLTDVMETLDSAGGPALLDLGRAEGVRRLVARGLERLERLEPGGRDEALRRLWYKWAAFALRLPGRIIDDFTQIFELGRLQETLARGYPGMAFDRDDTRVVSLSAYLGDGDFRTPPDLRDGSHLSFGEPALHKLFTGDLYRDSDDFSPDFGLEDGNHLIASVRGVEVRNGTSASSPSTGALAQEFVHIGLGIPSDELAGTAPDRLTAIVIGYREGQPELIPGFASVSLAWPFDASRHPDAPRSGGARGCTIRLNLGGMLEGVERVDVHLVGAGNA